MPCFTTKLSRILINKYFLNSRGSSISSEDFSSLASPDSLNDKSLFSSQSKFKRKQLKKARKMDQEKSCDGENSGSGHGKTQTLLKRRYSVPEIIMRKWVNHFYAARNFYLHKFLKELQEFSVTTFSNFIQCHLKSHKNANFSKRKYWKINKETILNSY